MQASVVVNLYLYWVTPEESTNLPAVFVGKSHIARITVDNIIVDGRELNNIRHASFDGVHFEEEQYEVCYTFCISFPI